MRKDRTHTGIILLLLISSLFSCSVRKHGKILALFFDGVPGPQEKAPVEQTVREAGPADEPETPGKIMVSVHPDYSARNCGKCHDRTRQSFLVTSKEEICFNCHQKEEFSGKYVHGPAAVNACSTCHDPHQSVNPALLLEKGKALCAVCHTASNTGLSVPCRGDDCLGCHDPHSSDNRYFLRGDGI